LQILFSLFGGAELAGWCWGWTSQPSQPIPTPSRIQHAAASSSQQLLCRHLKIGANPIVTHADFKLSNSNYHAFLDHAVLQFQPRI